MGVIRPGMGIMVTRWVGLYGTIRLAIECENRLRTYYPERLIESAKSFEGYLDIRDQVETLSRLDDIFYEEIGEGGIFNALWELSAESGCGLRAQMAEVPIRQETVEITEFFDLNPYRLYSKGSFIIVGNNLSLVKESLEDINVPSQVIGSITDNHDKIIEYDQNVRYLTPREADELYKVIRG